MKETARRAGILARAGISTNTRNTEVGRCAGKSKIMKQANRPAMTKILPSTGGLLCFFAFFYSLLPLTGCLILSLSFENRHIVVVVVVVSIPSVVDFFLPPFTVQQETTSCIGSLSAQNHIVLVNHSLTLTTTVLIIQSYNKLITQWRPVGLIFRRSSLNF